MEPTYPSGANGIARLYARCGHLHIAYLLSRHSRGSRLPLEVFEPTIEACN